LRVKNPNFADYQLFQRKTHDFQVLKITQNHQKAEKLTLFFTNLADSRRFPLFQPPIGGKTAKRC